MSLPDRITVEITGAAQFVINLDDPTMARAMRLTLAPGKRGKVAVTGDAAAIRGLLDDFESRGSLGGWDQPLWFVASARAAERAIKKQLAAQGIDVASLGPSLTARTAQFMRGRR